jgi:hypothetical protein
LTQPARDILPGWVRTLAHDGGTLNRVCYAYHHLVTRQVHARGIQRTAPGTPIPA